MVMSVLDFISGFFTPTYLFLFLNLIIGTIFITSRLGSHPPHHQAVPLARAPSLIERVRSINLSLYKFESHPEPEPADHYLGQDRVDPAVDGPPLYRAPSILDRFRSINFYQYKFEHPSPEPEPVHPAVAAVRDSVGREPSPLSQAPSLLDRLKSINFYHQKFDQPAEPEPAFAEPVDTPKPAPLGRAPSLLERVRSIKFSSLYKPVDADQYAEPDDDGLAHPAEDWGHGVRRIRSESDRMGEGPKLRMRKTASEKSVAAAAADDKEDEEEINAKADDFIQRFKHQLRLQRLDSIMRYRELLTGGAAAAGD